MRSVRSGWRLIFLGAAAALVIFALAVGYVLSGFERSRQDRAARELAAEAKLAALTVSANWRDLEAAPVSTMLATLHAAATDVVVAGPDGRILLDARREFRRDPPALLELRPTLSSGGASSVRAWGPGDRDYVVAAARVDEDASAVGVVWLARPTQTVSADAGTLVRLVLVVATAAGLAALAFASMIARERQRTYDRVLAAAQRLSAGDLSREAIEAEGGGFEALSLSLQSLRSRLAAQMALIDRQRTMVSSLVDQLQEGVIVARADGRIALINPMAARLLNLSAEHGREDALVGRLVEEVIPQHAVQRLLCDPLPLQTEEDSTSAHLNGRGSVEHAGEPGARLEVQSPNGPLHLLARATSVELAETRPDSDDRAAGRVVVLTDITALTRTLQMRTDFVANASHELRTPLSTIRAAIETLQTMDLQTEGPAATQFLEKIDRQSQRMLQMVSDLLDLSKLESPTERFVPGTVECRRVTREIYARFADLLERKRLLWDARVEPGAAVTMLVNVQLLRLVLDNLVDNAIKFTEPGGQIDLVIRHGGAWVTVEVRDTGCGIPAEEQQRVFERFYQVQRSRTGGAERGTGLGLSIVRHAVGAMGGTVELQSEVGRGTTISVRIPQRNGI